MKLHVGFCFSPDEIVNVGVLSDAGRDTAFEYDPAFAALGIKPSPFRLPVKSGLSVYDFSGRGETFGLFEDSLPDGWGRRLVDQRFRSRFGRMPTVLERLATVGMNGMGALVYAPEIESGISTADFDLAAIAENAMDFDAGKAAEALPQVRLAGGSSGGARPKANIALNPETLEVRPETIGLPSGFEHWIVKFNTRAEGASAGEREYRYYQMALAAGVTMSPCLLLDTAAGKFFATRRFDRSDIGERMHFATAAGLLHADFRIPGEEYSTLFRLTDALTHDYSQKVELFRRAALNVLAHNRDDHLKNFGFLMNGRGEWSLSPFYDFTRAEGPNGWHTLSIAGEGANPTEKDLLRLAAETALRKADAERVIDIVRQAVKDF